VVDNKWLLYAGLSAVFASLVAIFGKIGLENLDSTVATAIRSFVMSAFFIVVLVTSGLWTKIQEVRGSALIWISLSGVAGAISWLFYFRAIQLGSVTKVIPIDKMSIPLTILFSVIFLHEKFSPRHWLGVLILVSGAVIISI
jgi:transporter family protein